jgi:hypothetical protein
MCYLAYFSSASMAAAFAGQLRDVYAGKTYGGRLGDWEAASRVWSLLLRDLSSRSPRRRPAGWRRSRAENVPT